MIAGIVSAVGAAPRHQPVIDAMDQDSSYRGGLYAGDCESITLTDAITTSNATRESGSDETSWSYSFAMAADGSIGDVTAGPHSIFIERVEGDLSTSLACGELAGEIVGERLIAPLATTDSGEVVGIAVLRQGDDGADVVVEAYMVLSADHALPGDEDDDEPDLADTDVIDDSIDEGDIIDDESDDGNPEGGV